MTTVNDKLGGVPKFVYLELGKIAGRGGCVRFFMLLNGIKFTEELIGYPDEWAGKKKSIISSGDNPFGGLPTMHLNGLVLCEHVAMTRFLARKIGKYGVDPVKDYHTDRAASAYISYRDAWVPAAFGGADKKAFAETQKAQLKAFDTILGQTEGDYFAGTEVTFADLLLTGLIRDVSLTIPESLDLSPVPRVSKLYNSVLALEPIKKWIDSKA